MTTELQKIVDELLSTDRSSASIQSASELFLRFISLVKAEQADIDKFDKLMAIYKHRGGQFIRRISQSRSIISRFSTPFIQHNAVNQRLLLVTLYFLEIADSRLFKSGFICPT